MEEKIYCSQCGIIIETDDYQTIGEDIICTDCVEHYCTTCEDCGALMYDDDTYGDDYHTLCRACYEGNYTRCEHCDALIHNDDAYSYDDGYYCSECYHNKCKNIHEYSYKPNPIFYGDGSRYFGIELEIDHAGKDNDNAERILDIGNVYNESIYIKSDGSLDDGMEIVTHPMTLEYHLNEFCWNDILHECVHLGYRSHQTSTCGLHIHVNRDSLGQSREEQEETISRILYFVEQHWSELLKFSRRSESAMNRWAARYGYESTPKKILDKAKSSYGRYSAVNLCNYHTVEFRLFRGTLKLNTFIATLQMVNRICDVAFSMSDEEIQDLSWSEFVSKITEPELIQYLKERNIYINDKIALEEEI